MNKEEFQARLEKLENFIENLEPSTINSKKDEIEQLINEINELLVFEPENTEVLSLKGFFYELINDYKNAIVTYKKIIEIDPNNESAKKYLEDCIYYEKNLQDLDKRFDNYSRKFDSPSIFEKLPVSVLVSVKIIILLIIIFCYFPFFIFGYNDKNILKNNNYSNFEVLNVNSPSEYDYLSKQQIFDIRKNHVKNSLFNNASYEPNTEVFGNIIDNKPWWGSIRCNQLNYKGDYHENIEGPSNVSVQMNNPNALVGLSMPYIPWDIGNNKEFCTSDYAKFLPLSLQYNRKDKLIVAKYKLTKKFLKLRTNINGKLTRYVIQLSGLNARDFGYDYMYIFDEKNIKMYSEYNNATEDISTFRDYIHLGGSCKYKDGCNNISPMQNNLMFSVTHLPAEINIKLWKKKPINKYVKADMYYRIIFDR